MENIAKIKLILKEDSTEYSKEKIKTTLDVVNFLNKVEQANLLPQESTFILCMNSKNEVISYSEIARGGINLCNLDIKSIFKTVLLTNASKFILAHNHPSGDPTPSELDIKVTNKIIEASKIMDIQLLDHVVIGGNSFASCMYKGGE